MSILHKKNDLSAPDRARKRKERLENRAKRVYGDGSKILTPEKLASLKTGNPLAKPKERFHVTVEVEVFADSKEDAGMIVLKPLQNVKNITSVVVSKTRSGI